MQNSKMNFQEPALIVNFLPCRSRWLFGFIFAASSPYEVQLNMRKSDHEFPDSASSVQAALITLEKTMKHQAYRLIRPFALLFACIALSPSVQAGGWQAVETITKSPGNQYGEAVAVSRNGNIAAVTQALEPCPDGKLRCGAVYMYVQDQGHWSQQAKLFASDAVENTRLGGFDFYDRTVSLNDDGTVMAVATDPINGLGKGAVYIFVNNGSNWVEQQKITLPTAILPTPQVCGNDSFGRSLALSGVGNILIVGAGNECLATNMGAAFLFTKTANQWVAQTRLVGSLVEPSNDGNTRNSGFGSSVDISGDGSTLLVGSRGFPSDLLQAYIFNKNAAGAWVETAILRPADKSMSQFNDFGFTVGLNRSGNTALVGDDSNGAAYIYTKKGELNGFWKQEAKLGANITRRSSRFGFSLDLDESGTKAIIGDWGSGTAYLFTQVKNYTWVPQLIDSLGGGNGSSVTISGDATVILDSGPGRFTTLKK